MLKSGVVCATLNSEEFTEEERGVCPRVGTAYYSLAAPLPTPPSRSAMHEGALPAPLHVHFRRRGRLYQRRSGGGGGQRGHPCLPVAGVMRKCAKRSHWQACTAQCCALRAAQCCALRAAAGCMRAGQMPLWGTRRPEAPASTAALDFQREEIRISFIHTQ